MVILDERVGQEAPGDMVRRFLPYLCIGAPSVAAAATTASYAEC